MSRPSRDIGGMVLSLITHREQIQMSELSAKATTAAPLFRRPDLTENRTMMEFGRADAVAYAPSFLMHTSLGITIRGGGSDFEPISIIVVDDASFVFQFHSEINQQREAEDNEDIDWFLLH